MTSGQYPHLGVFQDRIKKPPNGGIVGILDALFLQREMKEQREEKYKNLLYIIKMFNFKNQKK